MDENRPCSVLSLGKHPAHTRRTPTRTPLIYNVTRGYNDYPSAGWNRLTGVDNGQGGNVALTLSAPTNATLGAPNPATLAILDDETPRPFDETYTYVGSSSHPVSPKHPTPCYNRIW